MAARAEGDAIFEAVAEAGAGVGALADVPRKRSAPAPSSWQGDAPCVGPVILWGCETGDEATGLDPVS